MSFASICVLSFVPIWVFVFCHSLSFWVFPHFGFCHNLSFSVVTFSVFEVGKSSSLSVVTFWIFEFVTIWVFELYQFEFLVLSQFWFLSLVTIFVWVFHNLSFTRNRFSDFCRYLISFLVFLLSEFCQTLRFWVLSISEYLCSPVMNVDLGPRERKISVTILKKSVIL